MSETKKIFPAIAGMMADMEAIGKDKKNQQQGFMYRGIDQVFNAVHPLFAKHKVFPTCEIVSREVTERATKTGGVLFYVNMKARYTFHAEDGSTVQTEAWGEAMDSGDKASNKAMSVAYKYAMFQLLCIPTEAVDPDSEVHSDVVPQAKKEPPKKANGKAPVDTNKLPEADRRAPKDKPTGEWTEDECYVEYCYVIALAPTAEKLGIYTDRINSHDKLTEDHKRDLLSRVRTRDKQLELERSPAMA